MEPKTDFHSPLLWLAAAMAAGCALAAGPGWTWGALAAGCGVVALSRRPGVNTRALLYVLALACAAAANRQAVASRADAQLAQAKQLLSRPNPRWVGVVERVVKEEPPRVVVRLLAAESPEGRVPFAARAVVNLPALTGIPEEGATLLFRAPLHPPRASRFPGDLDAAAMLGSRDIVLQGSVPERWDVAVLEGELAEPLPFWEVALARARAATRKLVRAELPDDAAALTEAFVLGDAPTMDETLRHPFDAAGAAHLLAVSGLQATLLAALLFALLKALWGRSTWLLERADPGPAAAVLCIPGIFLYAAYAGGAASVMRSAWMAAAAMLGVLWRRPGSLPQALGLAAVVMLVLEPRALADAGFLLSFLSVLSLVLLTPGVAQVLAPGEEAPRWRTWLLAAWASSAAAWLATTPLTAHLFGRVAVYGAFTNVALVPLGGLLLPAIVVLALVGTVLGWGLPVQVAGALGLTLRDVCELLSRLPGSLVEVPPPPAWSVALGLAGALLLAVPRRTALLSGMTLVLASCALGFLPAHPDDHALRVLLAPVGQGDGVILLLPDGAAAVVDAGGSWRSSEDPGASVMAPILRRQGVKKLRLVVLSHPHPDHLNGLASLVKEFPPEELWWNGQSIPHPRFRELMDLAQQAGARIRTLEPDAGQPWARRVIGGATFTVLHPFPLRDGPAAPSYFPEFNDNDNSLVLRVELGDTSVLLPGDMGADAEDLLLNGPEPVRAALHADVFKIPHHGSITGSSERLLNAVHPSVALLAVGAGNPWHFPHPEVMRRLSEREVEVWRTDLDGLVTVVLDGQQVSVAAHRRTW